jgi:hypothetical protein
VPKGFPAVLVRREEGFSWPHADGIGFWGKIIYRGKYDDFAVAAPSHESVISAADEFARETHESHNRNNCFVYFA